MKLFNKTATNSTATIRQISDAEMASVGGGAVTQEGNFTCVTSVNGSKTCVRTK